jgi:hypothetical protein
LPIILCVVAALTTVVLHVEDICLLVEGGVSVGFAQLYSLTLEFMQFFQLSPLHNQAILHTFLTITNGLNDGLGEASPVGVVHAIESSSRTL